MVLWSIFPFPLVSLSLSSVASWVERAQTFVRDEHFQLRLKILKEKRKKSYLRWGIRWSEIPSILMTSASHSGNKMMMQETLGWALCYGTAGLWLTVPSGFELLHHSLEMLKNLLGDLYIPRESGMKCLLIIHFYPLWNSLSLHCNLRSKLFGVVETHDKHMLLKVRMPSV